MSYQKNWSRNLIKGRIAEVVFEQMLREAGKFTVLPFGYEYTFPKVSQMKKNSKNSNVIDVIKSSPDFVVIEDETKKVSLIEVKYRKKRISSEIKKEAEKIFMLWKPAFLFIASPDGFYFDSVENIIKKEGKIDSLSFLPLTPKLQQKYLDILNDFEGDKQRK